MRLPEGPPGGPPRVRARRAARPRAVPSLSSRPHERDRSAVHRASRGARDAFGPEARVDGRHSPTFATTGAPPRAYAPCKPRETASGLCLKRREGHGRALQASNRALRHRRAAAGARARNRSASACRAPRDGQESYWVRNHPGRVPHRARAARGRQGLSRACIVLPEGALPPVPDGGRPQHRRRSESGDSMSLGAARGDVRPLQEEAEEEALARGAARPCRARARSETAAQAAAARRARDSGCTSAESRGRPHLAERAGRAFCAGRSLSCAHRPSQALREPCRGGGSFLVR